MKKLLVAMLVAVLCVPALADVDVTLADNADGSFNILLNTNGEAVRGLALKVELNQNLSTGQALVIGDDDMAEFNTCIDYAYSTSGYDVGMAGQHPYALDGDPGVAADGATTFVVSMGYLDQSEGQAAYSNTSATVIATVKVGAGFVTVTEDALRGGIVGDAALTVNMIDTTDFEVTDGPVDCIPASHADYAEWVTVGKPASWCELRQCYGDANGAENQYGQLPPPMNTPLFAWVTSEDLTILLEGYKKAYTIGDAWISADFNRQQDQYGQLPPPMNTPLYARVTAEDLTILLSWYKQSGVPTDCND